MKPIFVFSTLLSAILLCACGANRQMAQQPYPPQGGYYQQPPQGYPYYGQGYVQQPVQQAPVEDPEIAELKRQAKIDSIKREIEIQRLEQEQRLANAQANAATTVKSIKGQSLVNTFCLGESMDKNGEYMAGLGISSGEMNEGDALLSANRLALSDISSRFLGVVKNGVEQYSRSTNTVQRNSVKQSQLEGLAMSYAEQAINKYAEKACLQMTQDDVTGNFGCYIALHVPVGKVIDDMTEQLEEESITDFNKYKFKEEMKKELYEDQERALKKQQQRNDELQAEE